MSSSERWDRFDGWCLVGEEATEDLVGQSPTQRSHGLGLGGAGGQARLQVEASGSDAAGLGDADAAQRGVDLAVAAPVQAELLAARPDGDGRGAVPATRTPP